MKRARITATLAAAAVVLSALVAVGGAAPAHANEHMSKSYSAHQFKTFACRIIRSDRPFTRAVYRGSDAVTRAQFIDRFYPISVQARAAEQKYQRHLYWIPAHYWFHPSVRYNIRRLQEVTEFQRVDLYDMGFPHTRPRHGWEEFNDWRDRNGTWNHHAQRIVQKLDMDGLSC